MVFALGFVAGIVFTIAAIAGFLMLDWSPEAIYGKERRR
jgi:hypothetical protein